MQARLLVLPCAAALLLSVAVSGCATLGPVGAVGALGLGLAIGGSKAREMLDRAATPLSSTPELAREIRALLPAWKQVTTALPPFESYPVPTTLVIQVAGNPATAAPGAADSAISVEIKGNISPAEVDAVTRHLRQVAWAHARAVRLEFTALRQGNDDPSQRIDPRGLTFWVHSGLPDIRTINPHEEVWAKLRSLLPPSASGATGLWGQRARGGLSLGPGPRLEAWGDFSSESAQAVIDAATQLHLALPTTVYRDETRDRRSWKIVATHRLPNDQHVDPAP